MVAFITTPAQSQVVLDSLKLYEFIEKGEWAEGILWVCDTTHVLCPDASEILHDMEESFYRNCLFPPNMSAAVQVLKKDFSEALAEADTASGLNVLCIKTTLDEYSAKVLQGVLELFTRVKIGQWAFIAESFLDLHCDDYCKKRNRAEHGFLAARRYVYPDLFGLGHSYGAHHFPETSIAWEMVEAIRYALAQRNGAINNPLFGPYPPMSLSGLPLAKIVFEGV